MSVPVKIYRSVVYQDGQTPSNPNLNGDPVINPVNPDGGPADELVPYSGAIRNVDLGEKGLAAGYFKFDTTPTGTPADQGTMFWDEDDLTVDIILNGYRMKIGEDQFYPVKNQTGSNIPKGTSVRFAGTVGASGRLLIAPFLADGSLPSTRFMGVTAEDIDNGEDGKVLWFGRLRGINTSAYAEGDILYASTTVAGGFQTTVPVAPNNIVEIAAVVTDATNGTIFIRPQFLTGATIGGSGTTNYVPRFTGSTTIGNSQIVDNGTNVLINTTTDSGDKLRINGSLRVDSSLSQIVGSNPVLRIATTDNISTVNFRNVFNEDVATLQMSTPSTELGITTNVGNYNIRIQPHGTGKIKIPNVPTGTGDVLMRDASNNLVRGTALVESTGTFTPTLTDQGSGTGYNYTLSSANGEYVKIGKLVYFTVNISITSTSGTSGVGGLIVGNLPFTSDTTASTIHGIVISKMAGTDWSASILDRLTAEVTSNDTTIGFGTLTSAGGNLAPSITSGTIRLSGCYIASS